MVAFRLQMYVPDEMLTELGRTIAWYNTLEVVVDALITMLMPYNDITIMRAVLSRTSRKNEILPEFGDRANLKILTPAKVKEFAVRFNRCFEIRNGYAHAIWGSPPEDGSEPFRRLKHRGMLIPVQNTPTIEELRKASQDMQTLAQEILDTIDEFLKTADA